MSDTDECRARAERLARNAGMQYDRRYGHWVAARGKFEGEEWYAPYYWDEALNGVSETLLSGSQEDSPCADLFTVTGEESDAFGIECGHCVMVREDSQGFVYVTVHPNTRDAERKFYAWIGEPIG